LRRRTRSLAIAALITISIDLVLLSPAVQRTRQRRRDADVVAASLFGRSDKLYADQSKANADREVISQSFVALDSALHLASRPNGTGLPEAQTIFPGAQDLFGRAREAVTRLQASDAAIESEAKAARQDIAKLLGTLEDESDVRYAEALDTALSSLIQTQKEYARLTAVLAGGFTLYDMLFERTRKFLKDHAARTYRNAKEASQVYVLATGDLVDPIMKLRKDLNEIEVQAAASAEITTRAFMKAASLRQAGN